MVKSTIMVQARTGSQRFPRKVLAEIENKPLLWHVLNRVKRVKDTDQIILITTRKKEDEILLDIAKNSNIHSFAGDELDVLNRHYQCALRYEADPIIRITADCPLIDPSVVDKIFEIYLEGNYDFVSNCIPPTFPDGLDTEIFSFDALKKMVHISKLKSEREHVTTYIRNHRNEFRIYNYSIEDDFSKFRWTVDTEEDLEVVRKIYSIMKPKTIFSYKEILNKISNDPRLDQKDFGLKVSK